jgi:glucose-6-phosphate isomerase
MPEKDKNIEIEKSDKTTSLYFDLTTGLSPNISSTKRMLSHMIGMYHDEKAYNTLLSQKNVIIYEFYELTIPETPANLAYGTTILYPGKVGDEYFMTKGHFHKKMETAEVYYCIGGEGYLLMENPNGEVEIEEFKPGITVYVPPNYAHRSINTSKGEPLISFFVFRADAGHDYKTIETKGFRKLIVEIDGKPNVIDNPKWKNQN